MKPEIKAQWLTALRSGDYQQGQGYLRKGDQYCCLGVLCDLYGKAVGPKWEPSLDSWWAGIKAMHGEKSTLPIKVQEWAGVDDPSRLDLATLNDNGSTFEELADLIERNL